MTVRAELQRGGEVMSSISSLLVALLSWDAISLSKAVSSGVKWSHYPPALLVLSFAPLQVAAGSHCCAVPWQAAPEPACGS